MVPTKKDEGQEEEAEPLEPFGAQIPFADPSWYQNVSNPPRPLIAL